MKSILAKPLPINFNNHKWICLYVVAAAGNFTLGFHVSVYDRGQLNASVSYDVNEQSNLGIEAINLNKSEVIQSCVNQGAILCFQGLADRRITFGASYRF